MSSANWWKYLALAIASLSTTIRCSPNEGDDIEDTAPCNFAEAVNRLYRTLPDEMPLESKCKRYAVMLSIFKTRVAPNQLALLQVSALQGDILNLLYEGISKTDLTRRYIAAIDVYRTSHLEPAFIDLFECLRRVDTPLAKTYLNDKELSLIVDLYKQALGPPPTVIDLDLVDLSTFHPAFRTALKNLFGRHFETTQRISTGRKSRLDTLNACPQAQLRSPEQSPDITDELLNRIEKKRYWQHKFRERHLTRIREKDRIRKRRKRLSLRPISEPEPSQWPEGLTDKQLSKIERERRLKRERQKRYRERNWERVKAAERDRKRRRRLQTQQRILMQADANEESASVSQPEPKQQQGRSEQAGQMLPGPSLAAPGPVTIESSHTRQVEPNRPASQIPRFSQGPIDLGIASPSHSFSASTPRSPDVDRGDNQLASADIRHRPGGYSSIPDGGPNSEYDIDNCTSATRPFGPMTKEGFYEDLINCTNQYDDIESLKLTFLGDEPKQRDTASSARQSGPSSNALQDETSKKD